MIIAMGVIGLLYLGVGFWSLIFYIKDFVLEETKENGFDFQMIIVMLLALFIWPLFWFLRSLIRSGI